MSRAERMVAVPSYFRLVLLFASDVSAGRRIEKFESIQPSIALYANKGPALLRVGLRANRQACTVHLQLLFTSILRARLTPVC